MVEIAIWASVVRSLALTLVGLVLVGLVMVGVLTLITLVWTKARGLASLMLIGWLVAWVRVVARLVVWPVVILASIVILARVVIAPSIGGPA